MAKRVTKTTAQSSDPARTVRIVGIRVDENGHRALRLLAADTGASIQDIGVEALNDFLAKHGKGRPVKNPLA